MFALAFSLGCAASPIRDGDEERGHQKELRWSKFIPRAQQAKFEAARKIAMRDPAVQVARASRNQARKEFDEALLRAIVAADSSLTPYLEKLNQARNYNR